MKTLHLATIFSYLSGEMRSLMNSSKAWASHISFRRSMSAAFIRDSSNRTFWKGQIGSSSSTPWLRRYISHFYMHFWLNLLWISCNEKMIWNLHIVLMSFSCLPRVPSRPPATSTPDPPVWRVSTRWGAEGKRTVSMQQACLKFFHCWGFSECQIIEFHWLYLLRLRVEEDGFPKSRRRLWSRRHRLLNRRRVWLSTADGENESRADESRWIWN